MTTRYAPGTGTAIVGPGTVVLLAAGADTPLVGQLWPLVARGAALEELLDVLIANGLRTLPDLALLGRHDDGPRVLLRGDVGADLDGQSVRGARVSSWTEHPVDTAAAAVSLALGEPAAASLPVVAGIVLAGRVDVALDATADGEPARGAVAPVRPRTEPPAPVQQPTAHDDAAQELPPPAAEAPEPPAAPGPAAVPDDTLSADAVPPAAPPAAPAAATPVDAAAADTSDDRSYDHMFEATRRPPVAPTAVQPAVQPDTVEPAAPPAPPAPATPAPTTAPAAEAPPTVELPRQSPAPAPRPLAGGLIDAIPWSAGPSASPAPAAPPPAAPPPAAPAAVDDDRTLQRADQHRLVEQLMGSGDRTGPLVHAVRCPQGHITDPERERCRVCTSPLDDQPAVTVPRPVLGQLRLSTGDVVVLDRGVLLGRSPKTDADGAERPHLVKLGGPASDVSRTHVSVVLDGWHVLVKDLRSTNGTFVQLPGEQPQRLRGDEAMPIEPGTEVVLSDGISFRFEVAP